MDPNSNGFVDITLCSEELYEGDSSSALTDSWDFVDDKVPDLSSPSPPGPELESFPKYKTPCRWRSWKDARSERAKEASAAKTNKRRDASTTKDLPRQVVVSYHRSENKVSVISLG